MLLFKANALFFFKAKTSNRKVNFAEHGSPLHSFLPFSTFIPLIWCLEYHLSVSISPQASMKMPSVDSTIIYALPGTEDKLLRRLQDESRSKIKKMRLSEWNLSISYRSLSCLSSTSTWIVLIPQTPLDMLGFGNFWVYDWVGLWSSTTQWMRETGWLLFCCNYSLGNLMMFDASTFSSVWSKLCLLHLQVSRRCQIAPSFLRFLPQKKAFSLKKEYHMTHFQS